jgi:DNA-binding transcriptional ArsR family regulator
MASFLNRHDVWRDRIASRRELRSPAPRRSASGRARMLYSLVDGRARTATELAAVAEVTPATASVHLQRLKAPRLVRVTAQGKHRYYSLCGSQVADAL